MKPAFKNVKSRFLPERSYLYYKYPQVATDRAIEFYFPLLENVEISESQRPNLGTYDLLGRAGSLYSYHGAKSREFNLRFYLTLPNLLDYLTNIGLSDQFSDSFRYFYSERDQRKRAFLRKNDAGRGYGQVPGKPVNKLDYGNTSKFSYYQLANQKFSALLPPPTASERVLQNISKWTEDAIQNFENFLGIKRADPKQVRNSVDYLMLLVNVIRTSTLNNSQNTSLGPPTIYINHGTMYNNIPCVCTNYSIRLVTANGYDLYSLTPRQIEVSMNLSENRVGNFGAFTPMQLIDGENGTGWEAIIEERTLDPWNATFGEYDQDLVNLANYEEEEAKAERDRQRDQEIARINEGIERREAEQGYNQEAARRFNQGTEELEGRGAIRVS